MSCTVDIMRAGRLVTMLLLLQTHGRMTARALADELEVSPRTVFRDIEALSGAGVPVYSTRGPQGGFELLEHFQRLLPVPSGTPRSRAHLLVSPRGRQLATLTARPAGLRVRRTTAEGWFEATVVVESLASAVADLLSLGPEVEVVRPHGLRVAVCDAARRIAALYGEPDESNHG
jgi:predicted DNA-binding transcriptional regulator YafY